MGTQVTIKWNVPQNNGAPITRYTVYQRAINEDGTPREWNKIKVTTNLSDREVVIPELEKGKVYEFVVTASNEHGESSRAGKNIKNLIVSGGGYL